jgi:hypothetical protein
MSAKETKTPETDKQQRLAEQLRRNLRRRKAPPKQDAPA